MDKRYSQLKKRNIECQRNIDSQKRKKKFSHLCIEYSVYYSHIAWTYTLQHFNLIPECKALNKGNFPVR